MATDYDLLEAARESLNPDAESSVRHVRQADVPESDYDLLGVIRESLGITPPDDDGQAESDAASPL